jgi:hypothetical protein
MAAEISCRMNSDVNVSVVKKTPARAALVAICGFAVGCAPTNFRDAVPWMVARDRATDAKSQPVEGMPFLRVDDFLLDRFRATAKQPDDEARRRIPELAEQCHGLAVDSARVEIDQFSSSTLEEIWRTCFRSETAPNDLREAIQRRYLDLIDDEYQKYTRHLAELTSVGDLRKEANLICDRARPSVKDRRGGGLLMEMVRSTHPVDAASRPHSIAQLQVYELGQAVVDKIKSAFEQEDQGELLKRFAPVVAQEQAEGAKYSAKCDMIGAVRLGGRPNQIEVSIQTDTPSVYAYVRKAVVHDRECIQLVYCYWFPEHPPTRPGDPEAGPIDGATLRITLDSQKRPAIVEAIQNCGCHYRCFAAKYLDTAARREFGETGANRLSALVRQRWNRSAPR